MKTIILNENALSTLPWLEYLPPPSKSFVSDIKKVGIESSNGAWLGID